jgi:hypothetical protein
MGLMMSLEAKVEVNTRRVFDVLFLFLVLFLTSLRLSGCPAPGFRGLDFQEEFGMSPEVWNVSWSLDLKFGSGVWNVSWSLNLELEFESGVGVWIWSWSLDLPERSQTKARQKPDRSQTEARQKPDRSPGET